jgi:TolB-like protein
MPEVFISYARSTSNQARLAAEALRAMGYGVWRDDELPPHRAYVEVIRERLDAAKAVLVLWSSEAADSQWVRSEANQAREQRKLVQATLEPVRLPMPFDQVQCVDLAGWPEDAGPAWEKVVGSIAELVGRPPASEVSRPEAVASAPQRHQLRPRLSRRAAAGLAATALAIFVAAVSAWLLPGVLGPKARPPLRVAVLPFEAVGGAPEARAFAETLVDRMVAGLAFDQVVTISRSAAAGLRGPDTGAKIAKLDVALVLDGVVERGGQTLRVQAHLEDPHAHVTLWSRSFEAPASDAEQLKARIAQRASDVTRWAVSSEADPVRNDPAVLGAYLEARDEQENEGNARAIEIARDIVARAPRFGAGHELLATALGGYTTPGDNATSAGAQAATAETIREARLALALDPRNGTPYGHLASNSPFNAWAERERLLRKGFSIDPHNPGLACANSWFLLFNVGRVAEAIEWQKQCIRGESYAAGANDADTLSGELASGGRLSEAAEVIAEARRNWPDYWEIPVADFTVAVRGGEFDRALSLLDLAAVRNVIGPVGTSAWRMALLAKAKGDAAAVKTSIDAVRAMSQLDWRNAIAILSFLGDVDGAFRVADRFFTPEALAQPASHFFGSSNGIGMLYSPTTAALRRDPRFMRLAGRLGLIDYWRSTGKWPDFCADPALPYDCRAEAAKLLAARKPS